MFVIQYRVEERSIILIKWAKLLNEENIMIEQFILLSVQLKMVTVCVTYITIFTLRL